MKERFEGKKIISMICLQRNTIWNKTGEGLQILTYAPFKLAVLVKTKSEIKV